MLLSTQKKEQRLCRPASYKALEIELNGRRLLISDHFHASSKFPTFLKAPNQTTCILTYYCLTNINYFIGGVKASLRHTT